MTLFELIKSDFHINGIKNLKGFFILFLYRIAHTHLTVPIYLKPFTAVFIIFYRFLTEWILSVEIPWRVRIGSHAALYHGFGLVLNNQVKIGDYVKLRQGATIGNKIVDGLSCVPEIGNNVDIGPNCVIFGGISVGDNAIIGAGSIVNKDVPENSVIAGNPAQIIKKLS